MGLEDIFNEYNDTDLQRRILTLLFVIFIVFTLWLNTQFVGLNILEASSTVLVYLTLLVVSAVFFFTDALADLNNLKNFTDTLGLGSSKKVAIALVIGAVLGFFLSGQGLSVINPQSVSWLSDASARAFLFVVVLAPFTEEMFFRATLTPILMKVFGKVPYHAGIIVSIVLSSGAFALFHYSVYGQSVELMMSAFIVGLIANVGMYFTGSIGFGLGLHYMINYRLF